MLTKVEDGNGGKWILKRKFGMAFIVWIAGTMIAGKGVYVATDVAGVAVIMGSYSTFCGWLLGLIFTADVADKKLNGGKYQPGGE